MSVQNLPRVLSGRINKTLSDELGRLTAEVATHPLNSSIRTLDDLRVFLAHHVWCVWDFMCLVTAVEMGLRRMSVPWFPPEAPNLVYAIRDLLQGEETDLGPDGRRASHFEIYLDAMVEAGADTTAIRAFLTRLKNGETVESAIDAVGAPGGAKDFVLKTLDLAGRPVHERVGALCLGREDLLPAVFEQLLASMPDLGSQTSKFVWYIRRHIELDSASHGPLTETLFMGVTANNPQLLEGALAAGREAIVARRVYMDRILSSIRRSRMEA